MARERPRVPIVSLTPFGHIARRLCLLWGSHCVATDVVLSFDEAVATAKATVNREGLGAPGDQVIIMAGVPFNISGSTNIIRVARLEKT